MRAQNKGVLFAYSVEVDESDAAGHSSTKNVKEPIHKRIINEMLHSIDVAASFEDTHAQSSISPNGRRTWVAIKLVSISRFLGRIRCITIVFLA